MTIRQILFTSTVVLAVAVPAAAQEPDPAPAAEARAQARAAAQAEAAAARAEAAKQRAEGRANGGNFKFIVTPFGPMDVDAIYDSARHAIENSRFDRAIRDLDRVLAEQGPGPRRRRALLEGLQPVAHRGNAGGAEDAQRADEGVREEHVGQGRESARRRNPGGNGQPISAELQSDEELKLLALRGVMQADPDRRADHREDARRRRSPRVRDRALFVLSQSRSPRAREVMLTPRRTTTTRTCSARPSGISG